ncbi:hypothetical protein OS493_013113 [Desmophyllum pertusum]|uniref:Uncharacterized protein n=1 Tax=Desmophyllum pertusum TaxID=174260 RepID=A0A9W9YPX6_9CNID|nr:hypothetical protein OS493_013113 [Desmophyllum pertusum]
MASAYQSTTVAKEEREDSRGTGFCNPFHGRRHHDLENGHQEREGTSGDEAVGERNDRVNQWLFPRCVSRQDGQTDDTGSAVPTPAGSELHVPSATETVPPSKLNRAQTLKKKIIKGTENFFGLGDSEEQHDHLQRNGPRERSGITISVMVNWLKPLRTQLITSLNRPNKVVH